MTWRKMSKLINEATLYDRQHHLNVIKKSMNIYNLFSPIYAVLTILPYSNGLIIFQLHDITVLCDELITRI